MNYPIDNVSWNVKHDHYVFFWLGVVPVLFQTLFARLRPYFQNPGKLWFYGSPRRLVNVIGCPGRVVLGYEAKDIPPMNKAHKEIQRSKQNASSHLLAWCKKSLQICHFFLIPWSLDLIAFLEAGWTGGLYALLLCWMQAASLAGCEGHMSSEQQPPQLCLRPGSSPLWHPISWDCRCSSHHAQSRPQSANQKKKHIDPVFPFAQAYPSLP